MTVVCLAQRRVHFEPCPFCRRIEWDEEGLSAVCKGHRVTGAELWDFERPGYWRFIPLEEL